MYTHKFEKKNMFCRHKLSCRWKFRCRPNFRGSWKYTCRQKFSGMQMFWKNSRRKFDSSLFFSCRLIYMNWSREVFHKKQSTLLCYLCVERRKNKSLKNKLLKIFTIRSIYNEIHGRIRLWIGIVYIIFASKERKTTLIEILWPNLTLQ